MKSNISVHPRAIILTLILALYVPIISVQLTYDSIMHPNLLERTLTRKFVLPESVIKNLSFGFNNVLADYYWVSIIQDFAGWNRKDEYFIQEYKNLFTLDPRFHYPYIFAILTLPSYKGGDVKNTLTAEEFAKIGIKHIPDSWEIPYYMATAFQLVHQDDKVLPYLAVAVSRPIIPVAVKSSYELYTSKQVKGSKASREFIKTIYETTQSKTSKDIIKQGLVMTQIADQITEASQEYKKRFGSYPKSIDDIAEKGLITVDTTLKNKTIITIDQTTGIASVTPRTGP